MRCPERFGPTLESGSGVDFPESVPRFGPTSPLGALLWKVAIRHPGHSSTISFARPRRKRN